MCKSPKVPATLVTLQAECYFPSGAAATSVYHPCFRSQYSNGKLLPDYLPPCLEEQRGRQTAGVKTQMRQRVKRAAAEQKGARQWRTFECARTMQADYVRDKSGAPFVCNAATAQHAVRNG
ncbi:hypothetical protein MRX96_041740 [Rhipicephalus microplus]